MHCSRRLTPSCVIMSQDAQGVPQVERDLLQVEALSQRLKQRTARADTGSQTLAATRLLAQEGLDTRKCAHGIFAGMPLLCNPGRARARRGLQPPAVALHAGHGHAELLTMCSAACRLTRALQTFELRPSYEDVLPAESASVEEYLDQLHELTTVAAIQARSCMHAPPPILARLPLWADITHTCHDCISNIIPVRSGPVDTNGSMSCMTSTFEQILEHPCRRRSRTPSALLRSTWTHAWWPTGRLTSARCLMRRCPTPSSPAQPGSLWAQGLRRLTPLHKGARPSRLVREPLQIYFM